MNDKEPYNAGEPANAWVPKDVYDEQKQQQHSELKEARKGGIAVKIFFILLAIGGLMVAVALIGGLIAPITTVSSRGQQCTSSSFDGIRLLLNFVGYTLLLATGILGACINRTPIRIVGIVLIVFAPVASFIMFILALGKALCGA